jgi:pectate lyase
VTALRTEVRRGRLLAAVAVIAVVGTVVGLTAGTAAQAATVFSDNFDDGNATGWSRSGGSWSVATDGSPVYRQTSTSSTARSLATAGPWTNTSVAARVKPQAFNGTGRYAAVVSRAQNTTNFYYLALLNTNRVELRRLVGGASTTLAAATLAVSTGTWYALRLDASGTALRGYVDGTLRVSATDGTFSSGSIGFTTVNASAAFDDVTVDDTVAPPPVTTPPVTTTPPPGPVTPPADLVGFASVDALGQNSTTGGSGGPTVTVSTAAELIDFVSRPGRFVIRVNGVIPLTGMLDVTSDKTIVGVGAGSGITGGGLNVGLPVSDVTTAPADAVHNVIIRNLVFSNASDDAINVQMFSHHIWIDHNDLCCSFDGLVDIKRGSSYVTVSWNHTHNHTKNMLLGHDDNNEAQDVGRLKVTYHHNWYDRTPQRNPRIRFGEPVHVFNNYYVRNSDAGVACQENAGCVIEGNYFEDVEEPATIHYAGGTGRAIARNNVFVGESGQPDVGGSVQEPSSFYRYTLDDPNNIKAIVSAGAGTGKITT